MFQVVVEGMRQRSPAFRRQIARIGAAPMFRVRVLPEDRPRPTTGVDARTAFTFDGGAAGQCARLPSDDAAGTASSSPTRWSTSSSSSMASIFKPRTETAWSGRAHDTSFETSRAIEAGLLVEQEVARGAGRGAATGRTAADGASAGHRPAGARRRCRCRSEPDASAPTAGSSRSSRRPAWSSAIATTCATCTCSTVKPAGSRSRVSAALGQPADGESRAVDISADGRFVVFAAEAGNLTDPSLRSRHVSHIPAGPHRRHHAAVDGQCQRRSGERSESRPRSSTPPARRWRSSRGRPISLAPGPANGIFLVSLPSGAVTRVDVAADGGSRPGASMSPAISADGRYVVFASKADLTCLGARPLCRGQRRRRRLRARHPDERHETDQPQRLGR